MRQSQLYIQIQNSILFLNRLWRLTNFINQLLEPLNPSTLLNFFAYSLISISSSSSKFFIFSHKTNSISVSVGRPPPSFLIHPFFLHLNKFLLGISYFFDTYFTSQPLFIQIMNDPYLFDGCQLLFLRVLLIGASCHGAFGIWRKMLTLIIQADFVIETEGQIREMGPIFVLCEDRGFRELVLDLQKARYGNIGLNLQALIFFHFNILGNRKNRNIKFFQINAKGSSSHIDLHKIFLC